MNACVAYGVPWEEPKLFVESLCMGSVQGSQEAENVGCMSIPGDPGRRAADTTSVIPQSRGFKWG